VGPVLTPEVILAWQAEVEAIHVEDEVMDYVISLAEFTRHHPQVALGASPRASLVLLRAAKARALLHGRDYALPDDAKALAHAVLGHRLVLKPEAEVDGAVPGRVVTEALARVSHRTS
jgi:MoxR-like ATPase